ncbi:hypothetical protein MPSEU_000106200 [Mayamaea pseudoterrestris]|nr:hypothetical protein MPSEU_000106200 [Mayamaea pseudoterrestris]
MTDVFNNETFLRERDVVLTVTANGPMQQQANHMLQDAIYMQRFLYIVKHFVAEDVVHQLSGGEANNDTALVPPASLAEAEPMTHKIYDLLTMGSTYERACLRSVPFAYMSGPGRILDKQGPAWKKVSEEQAMQAIGNMLLEGFQMDSIDLSISPYSDFVRLLQREAEHAKATASLSSSGPIVPEQRDIILLPRSGSGEYRSEQGEANLEKMFENQMGNSILFNLASEHVTSTSNTPERRIKAALLVLQGLDDMNAMFPAAEPAMDDATGAASIISKRPHFLVRNTLASGEDAWTALGLMEAAEFLSTLVFEVWLEKESPLLALGEETEEPDTKTPIDAPTDHDVLLGRGGLTNSWPGNKRFRDIIALHRADYIRAIKMDKPAVARKIVRAVRKGCPPGRFLRKGDDGLWYDTGDKTAAEKTSQGLRERSNVEKRQRSELRKALRIRKVDLEDSGMEQTGPSKKTKYIDAARIAPTLNYVGTSIAVPLSLSMAHVVSLPRKPAPGKGKAGGALITEGLPPNATDAEGNILVTDYDILCGRGGLTNHHKGNRRFRDIVTLHRPDYVRASKIQKPSVARVIVRAIRNGDPPGRFLRKDDKSGKWIDIGDKKAAEKTSQALREKPEDEEELARVDLKSLGILLPTASAGYLAATTANVMGSLMTANADNATMANIARTSPLIEEIMNAVKGTTEVPDVTPHALDSAAKDFKAASTDNVGIGVALKQAEV